MASAATAGRGSQAAAGRAFARSLGAHPALWAALSALPALWPLFRPGFFATDDGLFHVYRIAALAGAWGQGVLYPRLFPDFGFGYGQAVLNFYAPLSYWPGALLALLGVNPAVAAECTIGLATVAAALAAYAFVRRLWGPRAGIAAAIGYTYFPYHLADAYVRGALPEYFAFVWPPLILLAFGTAFRRPRPAPALLWGALAWAALVYTHNLAAAMFAPVFLVYVLALAAWRGQWRRLAGCAAAIILAAALSAPLWLPFFAENQAVGIGLGPSDGYQNHLIAMARAVQLLPFYRYVDPSAGHVEHPLSWLTPALCLAALLAAAVRTARGRRLPSAPLLAFGLLLCLGAGFMTTAVSLPLWRILQPALAQLQYPWRFLMLAGLGAALVAGALPALLPGRAGTALAAMVMALIVLTALPGLPVRPLEVSAQDAWAPERMWSEDKAAGQVGATWTGEFLPRTVREQRWALGRAAEGATDGAAPAGNPAVRVAGLSYAGATLEIDTSVPLPIRLHQFYLPGWTATMDGQPVPVYPTGDLGLVTVDAPAGSHRLEIRFGPTPAATAAAVLAALAALAWAALAGKAAAASLRERPASGGSRAPGFASAALAGAGVALLAAGAILLANAFGIGQQTRVPAPAEARFGDVGLLAGSETSFAPGDRRLSVTLYWVGLRSVAQNDKAFVHLVDASGKVVAQHDGDPGGGFSPTTRWEQGELVPDRHYLELPADLPPGAYRIKAGLYQFEPFRNLLTEPAEPDGRVDLGEFVVK